MRTLLALIPALFCLNVVAQEKVVRLYDGPAPGSEDWKQEEQENRTNLWQTRVVYNVANPTLTVFLPEPAKAAGTAVVICPGGAFYALSIDREGFDVARWLTAKGIAGFVLKYRLIECKTDDPTREVMTTGDKLAPHSVALYRDWTAARKSAELHLYSKGGHGFGMRKQNLPSDHWIGLFADWLTAQGLLKK